jgi:hypothetical protein
MPTPYAGNPNNYPASINILSGSDTPSSGNFNTAYEGTIDRTSNLAATLWVNAIGNWQPVLASSSSAFNTGALDSFGGMTWEPLYGTWRVFLNAVGASQTQLWDSADGGKTFVKIGSQPSAQNIVSVASGAGQSLWAVGNGTSTAATFVGVSTSATVTSFTGFTAYTFAASLYYAPTGCFITWGGFQTSGTFTGGIVLGSTVTGFNGTNASVPSAFTGGTNHVGQALTAQSATEALFALCGATAGTDSAHLMFVTYPSSVLTATDVTPSFLGTTYIITGVAYDPLNAIWGLLVYNGANSYIYTSPDPLTSGSTWTQSAVFSGVVCRGLAVLSNGPVSLWAVGVPFPNGSIHIANRVMISMNQVTGGVANTSPTYYNTAMILAPSGSPQGLSLVSSGNQLAATAPASLSVSLKGGLG